MTVAGDVGRNATLTIEPGVEIRFQRNGYLEIGRGGRGTLIVNGSSTAPVRMTADAKNPSPGAWMGLFFGDQTDNKSMLEHLVVEYAGRDGEAAIHVSGSSPTISNSVVQFSRSFGILLEDSSAQITNAQVLGTFGPASNLLDLRP